MRRLLLVLALGLGLLGCNSQPGAQGTVEIRVSGLPAGITPQYRLRSPGQEYRIRGNQEISVPAGSYTLRSGEIELEEGVFIPQTFSQTVVVTAGEKRTVQLNYAIRQVRLELGSSGPGVVVLNGQTVTLPFSNTYPSGTKLELKAEPDDTWAFSGWNELAKSNPLQLTITDDLALNATFVPVVWEFSPKTINIIDTISGQKAPGPVSIGLKNPTANSQNFNLRNLPTWLTITPLSGTVGPGQVGTLILQVNDCGLLGSDTADIGILGYTFSITRECKE